MDDQAYQIPLEFDWMSVRQQLGGPPRVSALLSFDPRNPYDIVLTFYSPVMVSAGTPPPIPLWTPITWRFSREILSRALREQAGEMDVLAWPADVAGHRYVYIEIRNRNSESAVFRIGHWVIMHFVAEMERMVPMYEASMYINDNMDQELQQLLGEGNPE